VESSEGKKPKAEGGTVTLVCFAVKEEAAPFVKSADNDGDISVLVTGIGRKNAEASLRTFLSATTPELVLTCGFAGGLNPDLKVGDVVFETRQEDLRGRLLAAGAKTAKFFCAERVAATAVEKKNWREETGCDVVEMESEAIIKICRERQVPCATIRVISDAAHQDLPLDFNALMTPEQTISASRLALAVLKSPGKIPRLLELQRNTSYAARKLAAVLSSLLHLPRGRGA
jgi:adenosylhomocysteine nucleosidase